MADTPQFLEHACDATRILNKRRQLFDIKERFVTEKAKYDERCKQLRQAEADLSKRDLEFQAKLVRFEIFTKDNESKQKKLARRLAEEVNKCDDLDKEATKLTKALHQQLGHLKVCAEKQKKFRDVLGSHNISDVTRRYESINLSRDEMDGRLESLEREIETQRVEVSRLQGEASHSALEGVPLDGNIADGAVHLAVVE